MQNAAQARIISHLDAYLQTLLPSDTVYCLYAEDFSLLVEYNEVRTHCAGCKHKLSCYDYNIVQQFTRSDWGDDESKLAQKTKRTTRLYEENEEPNDLGELNDEEEDWQLDFWED